MIDADLVFIHGFWSSAATWNRLVARLREDESLAGLRVHLFEYESPKLPPLPSWRTRIPDYDDIAQSLPAFLEANTRNGAPLIIVTHSQGGLILQRFLAWMLTRGRGRALARISSIVMLSCPNEGSEYLASIRAALGMRHHPQASQLAVLVEDVRHSRQIVLSQIIYATQSDDYHCQIPVYAYSGRTDNVVLRQSAQSVFPNAGVLPGDHFSILDPDARGSLTQDTIRRHIVASLKPPGERRPRVGPPLGGEPGRPDVRQPPIRPDAYPVRESPSLPHDPWNIPPPVRAFIGRDAEIDALTRTLDAQQRPATRTAVRTAALSGTGGVGKTQLSRGFAHCHRNVYQIGWWIPAEDPAAAQSSLLMLATALGVPQYQEVMEYRLDRETGERHLAQTRRAHPAAERISMLWDKLAIRNDWLLIYDNAMSPAEIENLLPAQGDGHVLITSRSPAWHGVAEVLPVGLLAEAPAIDLLLRRTNSSDEEDAAVLATELGRLPLALEQAASYVADQGISLADYLDLYRLRQADLLRRGVPLAYEGTVATVVTLSLENLSSQQPLAVVVIELCALLAPDEIPISSIIRSRELLFPGEGEADLVTRTEAVGALIRCGLLVSDVGNTSRLHRLFQAVLLDQLTPAHFHDRVHAISSILHEPASASVRETVSLGYSMARMPPGYQKNELHISSVIRHGRGRVTSTAFADLLELYGSAVMFSRNFATAEPFLHEAVEMRQAAGKDGAGAGSAS